MCETFHCIRSIRSQPERPQPELPQPELPYPELPYPEPARPETPHRGEPACSGRAVIRRKPEPPGNVSRRGDQKFTWRNSRVPSNSRIESIAGVTTIVGEFCVR